MRNRVTLLNMVSSLLSQVVSIISGLIVPRLILASFGSDLNGLTASIGQFLSYIALVEGGVTGVIAANIYKPLVENNIEKLNSVLATARSFYKKIGFIFFVYALCIAFFYPVVVRTGYDYWYVVVLTIILSFGLFLEYMFSLSYTTLLNADKKVYIVSFTKIIVTFFNLGVVFLVTSFFPNLLLLKTACSFLFIVQPIVYGVFVKKHYGINWKSSTNNELIKERWNGFAINLAAFIHGSTDITLLTFFSDLKTVSVYSVYWLIVSKSEIIVHSIGAALEPTIGQAYAKGNENEINQKMDLFEYIIFILVGFLFSVAAMLITPFIMIYTSGIDDANYYQPLFGSLLVLAEALYLIRYPHVSLAYSANKFKEMTIPAYIEALINIVVSLICIKLLGLIGVSLGTIAGMLYRMIYQVYFTTKLIKTRKQIFFYKKFFIFGFATLLGITICLFIYPFGNFSIISWLLHGVVYSMIIFIMYSGISFLFFKEELKYFKQYLKK